jgi:hypothetical protein
MLIELPMNRTPSFDALGFTFTVEAPYPQLDAYLHRLLAALRTSQPARHAYAITSDRDGSTPAWSLRLDGQQIGVASQPETLIGALVHDLNHRAVTEAGLLTIHASAAVYAGRALLFPGSMEAGKSTLVAGLVRAGFGYLTDEAVGIDRETRMARPYPKPLSLDPGSWYLFPELQPQADLITPRYKTDQWLVPPDEVRPGAGSGPCPISLIVFPRFEAGTETSLLPVRRADALIELAKSTFDFRDHGRVALDLLADLVRGADCYRLTMADLGPAVELVRGLAGASCLQEPVP